VSGRFRNLRLDDLRFLRPRDDDGAHFRYD
jgi:hypothetical protein